MYPLIIVFLLVMYIVIARYWYLDFRTDGWSRLKAAAVVIPWPLTLCVVIVGVLFTASQAEKPKEH